MHSRRLFPGFIGFFFQALLLFSAPVAPAPRLETGELAGAKFSIAHPLHWNRRLLLIAHGYRDEKARLTADLLPDQLSRRALLDEGWMIATTSYRRNGTIVADAISDLDALRAHIAQTYGTPDRVILEGESMGGLIVTLIAEREPELYAGAVAIGAALSAKEANLTIALSVQPTIPLIFLSNQSELEGPKAYVTVKTNRPASIRPALFRVSRDGHVNINQRERLAALQALNAWIDRGRDALPRPASGSPDFDATIAADPQPSLVTPDADGRGFTARITEILDPSGNVILDAQPADFVAAGIRPRTYFRLTVRDQSYRVFYGRDFSSVKKGEWVALPHAENFFLLARNLGNAATTASLQLGDTLSLRHYDEAK